MKRSIFYRLCAFFLTSALLASSFVFTAVANGKTEKGAFVSRLTFDIEDSTEVKAIIVTEGDGGVDMSRKGRVPDVKTAVLKVESKKAALKKALTEDFGAELLYSYDALFNGVAVKASYSTLKAIERLEGVESVYIANSYSAPVATTSPTVKATDSGSALGFTQGTRGGTGTVIAVLDTGINTGHEAFAEVHMPSDAAIDSGKAQALIQNYGLSGKYLNKKIPYAYDFADRDTDISSSDQHGTNVASIAAGNNGVDFSGLAPNAQILGMKIFDNSGSTDSSIYFAAMEEAYLLGADVINMSIGSVNGFSYDFELETVLYGNIYEKLKDEGVFVCCAAGNEYSQGYWECAQNFATAKYYMDAVTADYADYGTINSPASYTGCVAVAAAGSSALSAHTITVNGEAFPYIDSAEGGVFDFFDSFYGQTLSYVMVPGMGRESDYTGLNVRGKVAVVARGEIDFGEKQAAAANAGAVAMVCYNNRDGDFTMEIEPYVIPSISVRMPAYEAFKGASSLKVDTEVITVYSTAGMRMSDFSSWGVTPDLLLKPELTGVGSNVICAYGNGVSYTYSNGTSMATPVISGVLACAIGYSRDNLPALWNDRTELYDLVYDSVISSATVLFNDGGSPYSPRKQGAGVPEFVGVNGLPAVIDEPILSLGDDPERRGTYTFTVKIENISGESLSLSLGDAYVLCDKHQTIDGSCYNTLTSHPLTANVKAKINGGEFTDGVYTMAANQKSTELTVEIALSDEAKEYMSAYTNGGFIEGYAYIELNGGEYIIKQTFMGFYGDWSEAPTFEAYDWGEVVNAKVAAKNSGENNKDYTALLNTNVGYNEAYLTNGTEIEGILGDNLYDWVEYDYDRMAFPSSENNGNCLADSFTIYPSLLRNVRHIIMTVSNADTGEIYYVDDTEYAIKNFYDFGEGIFIQGTVFTWDGSYYDGYGNLCYAEDGTKIKVSFETQLDCEGAELVTEREYYMYIDNSAPEFTYSWDKDRKRLTVRAKDDRYISNVFVYTGDYAVMHKQLAVTDSTPGEWKEWTIDLSDTQISSYSRFYLEVQDYATNYDNIVITTTVSSSTISDVKGDVNLDGMANSLDAAAALKYDVQLISLTDKQINLGDVDGSGCVDNLDAAQILRYDAFGIWPK